MNQEIKRALTAGLLAGYGGEAKFGTTVRGGTEMKQSHFEKEGIVYHDEWLPSRTGGGQEIVAINGQKFTRLYAGGIVGQHALAELGIGEDEIISTLINQIKLAGEKTRLDSDYTNTDGDWDYSYQVKKQIEEIGLILGKERIKHKDQLVFVHYFLLSPIT